LIEVHFELRFAYVFLLLLEEFLCCCRVVVIYPTILADVGIGALFGDTGSKVYCQVPIAHILIEPIYLVTDLFSKLVKFVQTVEELFTNQFLHHFFLLISNRAEFSIVFLSALVIFKRMVCRM
jgi:hypothetical protein